MGPSRGGRPRSIAFAQRRACVRAITVGGLDNVVDVSLGVSTLNVVVSTNTMRRALDEASLGSLEKHKKPLLTAKNVRCKLEFAQHHQDWTINDWYRAIFSGDIKLN